MKRRLIVVAALLSVVTLAGAGPAEAASSSARYAAFRSKMSSTDLAIAGHIRSMQDALEYEDMSSAADGARQVSAHASSGVKWLDKNKPAACYKRLWTAHRRQLAAAKIGYAALARFDAVFPDGDPADWDTFLAQAEIASDAHEDIVYLFPRTRC